MNISSVTSGSLLTSFAIFFCNRNVLKLLTFALYVESDRSLKALSQINDTVLFLLVTPILFPVALAMFEETGPSEEDIPETSERIEETMRHL